MRPADADEAPAASPVRTRTVTFVLTDVEGSTRMWSTEDRAVMDAAIKRHHDLIALGVERGSGELPPDQGEGDARFAVFDSASGGVECAAAIQRSFARERWGTASPLQVRIAVHTGEAHERGGNWFGAAISRCARLRSLAAGGQTLVSGATASMLVDDRLPSGTRLDDLGEHRLKDLDVPERVYQLAVAGLRDQFPPLRSLDACPHNLPVQQNAFVGRDREVGELCALLSREDVRLVTLVGPGGVGKTRLALQCAAELSTAQPDGTWLVELAAVTDHRMLVPEIARALAIREEAGHSVDDTVRAFAGPRRMCIVLDNFEQITQAAVAVADLLACSPRLKVLVTSREPLRIRAEHVYVVEPLSTTADGNALAPAAELFLVRAAAAGADAAHSADIDAVSAVCHRLDGLPLAIELAASRTRFMGVPALSERLAPVLDTLKGGPRDAPGRHQTMRATIAWSYDLLGEDERRALGGCALFAGTWSLEAAEYVCGESIDAIECLSLLHEKSLVARVPDAPGRFSMLTVIREFALGAGDSDREAERRFVEWHLRLAGQAEAGLDGGESVAFMQRLDTEQENLLHAIDLAAARDDVRSELRLAALVARHGLGRHQLDVASRTCARALERADAIGDDTAIRRLAAAVRCQLASITHLQGEAARARELYRAVRAVDGLDVRTEVFALLGLGAVHREQGEPAAAREALRLGLAMARESGHPRLTSQLLDANAAVEIGDNNLAEAGALLTEALRLAEDAGELGVVAGVVHNQAGLAFIEGRLAEASEAYSRVSELAAQMDDPFYREVASSGLGNVAWSQGRLVEAAAFYETALDLARRIGQRRRQAVCLNNVGLVAHVRGHLERAREAYAESARLAAEIDDRIGLASTLRNLAALSYATGDLEAARGFAGEGLALSPELGDAVAAATLGNVLAASLWVEGRLAEAEAAYLQALRAAEDASDRTTRTALLHGLADVKIAGGDLETAARLLSEALREAEDAGLVTIVVYCLVSVASLSLERGDVGEAMRMLRASARIRVEAGIELDVPYARYLDDLEARINETSGRLGVAAPQELGAHAAVAAAFEVLAAS